VRLIGLLVVVLSLWIITPFTLVHFMPSWESRGQFGDLFGSVNALFSGFAFAGLLYTIYLQRNELALQREELRLQREEMAASRAEIAGQGKTQLLQYKASIVELKVQAANMEVEALKMESEQKIPSARKEYYEKIREQANNVQALVNELENG